jgi:hypothetical protein
MKPLAIVVLLVVLTGCTAEPQPAPVEAITAERTCKQVSNVLTVLYNASVSRSEERISQQELDGAVALADSMLDEVQVNPGSTVEAMVVRLRDVDPGGYPLSPISRESAEWTDAIAELRDACKVAESELYIMAWTGG